MIFHENGHEFLTGELEASGRPVWMRSEQIDYTSFSLGKCSFSFRDSHARNFRHGTSGLLAGKGFLVGQAAAAFPSASLSKVCCASARVTPKAMESWRSTFPRICRCQGQRPNDTKADRCTYMVAFGMILFELHLSDWD